MASARSSAPAPIETSGVRPGLDAIWIEAAASLGFPVARGGDAYVHWDGRALWIASDPHLDADDTVAQLVLHELCHFLTEGPARLRVPDWGLDNTSAADEVRELASLRLQAHLLGAYSLRDVLYPTTVVKPFFLGLPRDAFAGGDGASIPIAREAAQRAAAPPFGPALQRALEESATLLGLPRHRSGHVLSPEPMLRCGDCAFRTPGGLCRKTTRRTRVAAGERACARFERLLDCEQCAACCRSAYDAVLLTPRAPLLRKHPGLVELRDGAPRLRRAGDRCAALAGAAGGPWQCTIYGDRPRTCRDFGRASPNCLVARRRVGLSF